MMKPGEVEAIRKALGDAVGGRVSQDDLGQALGLSEHTAQRKVREWEKDGPTGPAASALFYLSQGVGPWIDQLPEYLPAGSWMVRLHWPRFVAVVRPWSQTPSGTGIKIDEHRAMAIAQWIDNPEDFWGAEETGEMIQKAAAFYGKNSPKPTG